jgi:hypothetical protein
VNLRYCKAIALPFEGFKWARPSNACPTFCAAAFTPGTPRLPGARLVARLDAVLCAVDAPLAEDSLAGATLDLCAAAVAVSGLVAAVPLGAAGTCVDEPLPEPELAPPTSPLSV